MVLKTQKMWPHHESPWWPINSTPRGQNGHHFADNMFRCIFVNEKFCILIESSLKFVPKGPIDDNPALVQIMGWCWIGDKPLSEAMLTQITGMYASVNSSPP